MFKMKNSLYSKKFTKMKQFLYTSSAVSWTRIFYLHMYIKHHTEFVLGLHSIYAYLRK